MDVPQQTDTRNQRAVFTDDEDSASLKVDYADVDPELGDTQSTVSRTSKGFTTAEPSFDRRHSPEQYAAPAQHSLLNEQLPNDHLYQYPAAPNSHANVGLPLTDQQAQEAEDFKILFNYDKYFADDD